MAYVVMRSSQLLLLAVVAFSAYRASNHLDRITVYQSPLELSLMTSYSGVTLMIIGPHSSPTSGLDWMYVEDDGHRWPYWGKPDIRFTPIGVVYLTQWMFQMEFPWWLLLAFLTAWVFVFRRYVYRPRAVAPAHCTRCGYDLRATPERCPECGQAPAGVGVA